MRGIISYNRSNRPRIKEARRCTKESGIPRGEVIFILWQSKVGEYAKLQAKYWARQLEVIEMFPKENVTKLAGDCEKAFITIATEILAYHQHGE